MRAAMAAHDTVFRSAIEAHGGFMFKHTNDRLPCPPFAWDAAVSHDRVRDVGFPQIVRSCR